MLGEPLPHRTNVCGYFLLLQEKRSCAVMSFMCHTGTVCPCLGECPLWLQLRRILQSYTSSMLGYVQFGNIPAYAQIGHHCEKGELKVWKFWESLDSQEFEGDSMDLQREHLRKSDVALAACLEAARTVESVSKTRMASAADSIRLGRGGPSL